MTGEGAMRKAILTLMLVAASGSALAVWELQGTDQSSYLYADPTTIHKNGNKATMSDLVEYKTRQSENDVYYQSSRVEVEYDCDGKQYRNLSATLHPYSMGGGDAVSSFTSPDAWQPIPPGSGIEVLGNIACGKTVKGQHKKKKK
jgi:hypothetical protein